MRLQTLWFLQAALQDLSSRRDSQSFVICQRVLHKCHEIIFSDPPAPRLLSSSPYASLHLPTYAPRRKIKHHAEPVFVGIGVILAGAPGMPQLVNFTGQVVIEQGRADEEGDNLRGVEPNADELIPNTSESMVSSSHSSDDQDGVDSPLSSEDTPSSGPPSRIENVQKHRSLTRRRTVAGAQTVPALPLHLRTIRRSRASEDPLGQLDVELNAVPYQSSPSLPSSLTPLRSTASNPADTFLEQYDEQSQSQLLRSHYCLSEVCGLSQPTHTH